MRLVPSDDEHTGELAVLRSMHERVVRLLGTPDLPSAAQEVLDASLAITGRTSGTLHMLALDGPTLELLAHHGVEEAELVELRRPDAHGDALLARVLRGADPLAQGSAAGTRGHLVPLVGCAGDPLGVLSLRGAVGRVEERAWRLLDQYLRAAAPILERTRREEGQERRARELAEALDEMTWLQRLGERFAQPQDLQALYDVVLDEAAAVSRCDIVSLHLLAPESGRPGFEISASRGLAREQREAWQRLCQGIARSIQLTEQVVIDATRLSEGSAQALEAARELGLSALVVTPVAARARHGRAILCTGWRQTPEELTRLAARTGRLSQLAAGPVAIARAKAEIRISQERLRLALEAGELGDWQLNLETGEAWTSFRHDQCFGATEPFDEWSYERFMGFVHPDDRAEVQKRFDAALASGEDWGFQCRVVWADRSLHWIEASGAQVRGAPGMPRYMIGVVREITALKEKEERILFQARMLDVVGQAVIATDPHGAILYWNRAAEEAFGWSAQDVRGRNVTRLTVASADRVDASSIMERLREGRSWSGEFLVNYRDGVRPAIVTNSPMLDERGEVKAIIGVSVDVSELKAAQRALEEVDRRKDEFLATLGHELRNPLSAIRMALQLLQASSHQPDRVEGLTDVIERQSGQLVRLIDDLLDVNRITQGKIALHREATDLSAAVRQAIEGVQTFCAERGVTVIRAVPGDLVVDADPVRLGQVVVNLLHNACKFAGTGGRVRITAARDGAEAVLRVQDDGEGIPSEQLHRIFGMFSQIHPIHNRETGGLGIGLALSKRLVEMHGGSIEARSEGPGKGAEFIVRLPLAKGSPA